MSSDKPLRDLARVGSILGRCADKGFIAGIFGGDEEDDAPAPAAARARIPLDDDALDDDGAPVVAAARAASPVVIETTAETCGTCDGFGRISARARDGRPLQVPCPTCGGKGTP